MEYEFSVDQGVPIPASHVRNSSGGKRMAKYPLPSLEMREQPDGSVMGDSFFTPFNGQDPRGLSRRVHSAVGVFRKKMPDRKFKTKRVVDQSGGEGLRVWRVA